MSPEAKKPVARPGGPGNGPRGMHASGKPKDTKSSILRLLSYLKPEILKIIIALICVLVTSITTLVASYLLKPIINDITTNAEKILAADEAARADLFASATAQLLGGILMMLLIYGFGIISTYLQQRIMISVSQRALIRIRKDLFNHLQDMPVKYFDTNSTGDVMSRFTNDVDAIGEMMNNTIYFVHFF